MTLLVVQEWKPPSRFSFGRCTTRAGF
jgi:hypothetical protein